MGKTIFHHAPESNGARDYASLADEVIDRLRLCQTTIATSRATLSALEGGAQ